MIVSWTALSLVEARGHIIYYTVNYWPTSYSELVIRITVPHTTTRVDINNLLFGETYIVQVSASTSVGEGLASVELSSTRPPPGEDMCSVNTLMSLHETFYTPIIASLFLSIYTLFSFIITLSRCSVFWWRQHSSYCRRSVGQYYSYSTCYYWNDDYCSHTNEESWVVALHWNEEQVCLVQSLTIMACTYLSLEVL